MNGTNAGAWTSGITGRSAYQIAIASWKSGINVALSSGGVCEHLVHDRVERRILVAERVALERRGQLAERHEVLAVEEVQVLGDEPGQKECILMS